MVTYTEARTMALRLCHAWENRAGLSTLYREWIGYCPFEDNPDADPIDVHRTLNEYLSELCENAGIDRTTF